MKRLLLFALTLITFLLLVPLALDEVGASARKRSVARDPFARRAVACSRPAQRPGATVAADVVDGAGTVTHLRLYDDGRHADGAAGDGIYGNWFRRTNSAPCRPDPESGNEQVCDNAYHVYGVATAAGDVQREDQTAFAIEPGSDADGDGLPDNWELEHGLDPNDVSNGQGDPDGDRLNNFEEFWQGTDPFNPDSDGGGESDGSEVQNDRNPLDPADDTITPVYGLDPRPGDGVVTLRYTPHPFIDFHRIFRRPASEDEAWSIVADGVQPTGTYTDTAVSNGGGYQYRLVPVAYNGAQGRPILSPIEDTTPPDGLILINGDAASTSRKQVTLQLDWRSDVVALRLGNQPVGCLRSRCLMNLSKCNLEKIL